MHIAVDAHNLLHDRRGIAVYVRAVLAEFAARDDLDMTLVIREWFPKRRQAELAQLLGSNRFGVARNVPNSASVMWHPWNGTFAESRGPSVATIHDCAPFALPNPDRRTREREQAPFVRSAETAKRILTDSAFSAEEIERHLGVPHERITIVPLAADAIFAPGSAEYRLPGSEPKPYVLVVGAGDARKNRPTLVAAWRRAFPDRAVALACIGGTAEPGTLHAGDLTETQLRDVYRNALCFAMPSTYEGFGLPALEAMQCGTPVIASRAASLPEVCGDAALYVDDPLDVAQWAEALQRVAADSAMRSEMSQRGFARAAKFSWTRCATQTLDVLREAAR